MYVFVFAQSVQKKANICSPKQWRTEAWSIEEGEKGGGGGGGYIPFFSDNGSYIM